MKMKVSWTPTSFLGKKLLKYMQKTNVIVKFKYQINLIEFALCPKSWTVQWRHAADLVQKNNINTQKIDLLNKKNLPIWLKTQQ